MASTRVNVSHLPAMRSDGLSLAPQRSAVTVVVLVRPASQALSVTGLREEQTH